MKKFLPFLILIILVGIIAASTYKLNNKQNSSSQNNSNQTLSKFVKTEIDLPEFSLPGLFDEYAVFSKKDLIGKYSLINFFASWCTTCRGEHDVLIKIQEKEIIDIYGIAWRDIDENTKAFLKESGNPFKKVARDSKGMFNEITGITAVPESLIIDKYGNVVMRLKGNLQESSIDEIEKFLNSSK